MPHKNLEEIAKELFNELQKASEKYVQVKDKREKIIEMEIINVKELKVASPRFKIVTEKGNGTDTDTITILEENVCIIENGVEKRIVGA